jgi:GntR family transcriptional regulator of arabinose operon
MEVKNKKKTATQAAVEVLSEDISNGRYLSYMPFPTELSLCERFGLSRMTIRLVLSRLEQKGLIYRQQGRGTFVYPLDKIQVKPIVLLLREFQKAGGPYITEIVSGANAYLNSVGSHILIKSNSPCEWSQKFIQSISGVIVIPVAVYREDVEAISSADLPYIVMMESDLPGPTVRMSPREAANKLTEGLIKLGHRDFALVSGHDRHTDQQKRIGIEQALTEAGINFEDVPDYKTNYDSHLAEASADQMMHLAKRPTAVIAFDDSLAVIVMSAASRAGFSIPQDISIVGFNDASFSALINPPLSTVRFPILQAGNMAAKNICENYIRVHIPEDIQLGYEIVWRSSTGPAM